jgi:hypothetical protein
VLDSSFSAFAFVLAFASEFESVEHFATCSPKSKPAEQLATSAANALPSRKPPRKPLTCVRECGSVGVDGDVCVYVRVLAHQRWCDNDGVMIGGGEGFGGIGVKDVSMGNQDVEQV